MNIFKLSPFVEKQFKQSPELNHLLSSNFDLNQDWLDYKNHNPHLDIFSMLRKYRQSRLALIASKDLNYQNPTDHIKTLKKVSALAKLMIECAYEFAIDEIEQKFGQVYNQNNQQSFIIFALGKLGGNELNYSSDIDLVFCYTDKGESNGIKGLDAMSYYTRLGRRIIQILGSVTADGLVYRVDMRLRPFGSAAPLVCSISNLLNYLETEGRDWERYAWLRASIVAGNKAIGKQTLTDIEPFIYRKYLDYNIFESLRQIKQQIIRNQQGDLENIKLGIGGIREIEFIVQTLQLTFAGRNKQLQGNDLWQQMHNLKDFGHISVKNSQQLTVAWLFLRKLENLCQIVNDRDVHHLPKDPSAIALCIGCNNANELQQQLKTHNKNVHDIFAQLFLTNQSKQTDESLPPQIQQIKDEISQRNFPKSIKHKIYDALDAITPLLKNHNNQDILIQRYQQVISAVSKRISYLSMLIESPIILKKLITQLSHGAYFSNCIAKTPALLEVLFDNLDEHDFNISQQWQFFINKYDINDNEQYLELLCQFKQTIQFRVIMAYVDGINDAKSTSKILTRLAQYILSLVIKQAWQQTQANINSKVQAHDLIVIAYGSLAIQNMHLQSDFDIVFLLNQDITDDNHKFIMRWIKRIIHLLSIKTYSGSLYQLDTQLRPNGKSGAVIVTKSNFENYQIKEAWLWEHAALIKSRAVYATQPQEKWFNALKKNILCQKRDPKIVDIELKKMAKKLDRQGNKNHQQEFNFLGTILKQSHQNPDIFKQILSKNTFYKTKLDNSINK